MLQGDLGSVRKTFTKQSSPTVSAKAWQGSEMPASQGASKF